MWDKFGNAWGKRSLVHCSLRLFGEVQGSPRIRARTLYGQAEKGAVKFKIANIRKDAEPGAGAESWKPTVVPCVNPLVSGMRWTWGYARGSWSGGEET